VCGKLFVTVIYTPGITNNNIFVSGCNSLQYT